MWAEEFVVQLTKEQPHLHKLLYTCRHTHTVGTNTFTYRHRHTFKTIQIQLLTLLICLTISQLTVLLIKSPLCTLSVKEQKDIFMSHLTITQLVTE